MYDHFRWIKSITPIVILIILALTLQFACRGASNAFVYWVRKEWLLLVLQVGVCIIWGRTVD